MDENEKFYALQQFQLNCLSLHGQAFQDFFIKIMKYAYPLFESVKSWGNQGDKKNDGFIKSEGKYFQIYSPEQSDSRLSEAIRKINTDFRGLHNFWQNKYPIKEFNFVFNSKDETNPLLEEQYSKLKSEFTNILFKTFSRKELEKVFISLKKSEIQIIVGGIPSPEELLRDIDFSVLPEVITHILNLSFPEQIESPTFIAPNFDEKIKFNNLVKSQHYLNNAYFQISKINQYFLGCPEKKELLREKFSNLYKEAVAIFQDNSEQQFHYILDKASPVNTLPIKNAVISLMAIYFESCDIFKEPQKK